MRIAAACALVLFVVVPIAVAATVQEEERRQYKAQVDPVCKKNTEENDTIIKGVRRNVKKGRFGPAGQGLMRAATALHATLGKLQGVPQPPSDTARLTKWLKQIGEQVTLLRQTGKAIKEEKLRRAERLTVQLEASASSIDALVRPFSFRYCRFENKFS